ncbi:MAG: FkbM family methyltransferase [Hyphomicrobium sp.]|nr:FkbM family methyltransferase [Hyphomicrobium sp.]
MGLGTGLLKRFFRQPRKDPERPTRDFYKFFTHLKRLGFDPAVCIDVGAAHGTPVIYTAFPNAFHVAFEPLPDFHDGLGKSLEKFKHRIHHCALMDKDGELEILRAENNLYGSSMMHSRADTGDPRLIKVPVRRLDDVMAEHPFNGQLLLKTDCQGSDLLVVKGGLDTLAKADVVILETSMFSFWGHHQADFTEIVAYMADKGFVVYDILDGMFRPSDNALGQVDLVFAKRNGFLRASKTW